MAKAMPMFDRDAGNRDKNGNLLEVTRGEAEEALTDPARAPALAYSTPTEARYAIVGATAAGRILYVVYTMRGSRFRVISARVASRSERRLYSE